MRSRDEQPEANPGEEIIEQRVSEGASAKWRVDTTGIRNSIENQLKGRRLVEKEFQVYKLLKATGEEIREFLATDDDDAKQKVTKYAQVQDKKPSRFKFKPTDRTKTREVYERKEPMLPDDVADQVLASVDSLFSQVGYLTQLTYADIQDIMWENISEITSYLTKQCIARQDVELEKLDLVVNLIQNMIYPVLKSAEKGWTGEMLTDSVREKVTVNEGQKQQGMMDVFKPQ